MTTHPGSASVPAQPSVLRWAREYARYSLAEAAALLGVPKSRLRAIEQGDAPVTSEIFRKMRSVYRQVDSVLLLPRPPETPPLPNDYRTVGAAPTVLSRETLEVIREARRIQDYLTELTEEEPELVARVQIPKSALSDDPVKVAEVERRALGVDIETQTKWPPKEAFDEWRSQVQGRGVAVLLARMPWEDCRGLSLWEADAVPVVVVNSEDSTNARSFTLFHEYAHLVLRQSGICVEEPSQTIKGQVERWCNAFAANFLVPSENLRTAVEETLGRLGPLDWELKHVKRLATKFRVSPHAMARRLKEVNISHYYDTHIAELRRSDKKVSRKRTGRGNIRPEVQRLAEVGTGVAFVVLDAWKGDLIDAGEAADILRLKPDQLRDFEQRAETKRRKSA